MNLTTLDTASLLSLTLTIVALLLALMQSSRAKSQAKELQRVNESLRKQAHSLEHVGDALTTKFIGVFPKYLSNVQSILNNATESIDVLGMVSHAVFSDHAGWREIHNLLGQKCESGVAVSIVCADRVNRRRLTTRQFGDVDWKSWRETNAEKLETLLRFHAPDGEVTSPSDFCRLVNDIEDKILSEGLHGMEVQECPFFITNLFWLRDKQEAVFSILTLSPGAVAYGFYTSDPRLISALLELKERYSSRFVSSPEVNTEVIDAT